MSIIQFVGVSKSYPDGTVVLENLAFEVKEGGMLLITGPSGSGKTTIMRLLIGEVPPDQGEIIFNQQSLAKLKGKDLYLHRRQIGVVFQDYKLIEEMNVWENIALPLLIKGEKQAVIEEKVTDLLRLVELADKAWCFPRQLSGGEAQRISIARALANSPKLIFADEPTGNLDEANSLRVLKLLTKINQLGTTLLLATHDPLIINSVQTQKIELIKNKPISDSFSSQPASPEATTKPPHSTQEQKDKESLNSLKVSQKEAAVDKPDPKTAPISPESREPTNPIEPSAKKTRIGSFWARFARPTHKPKLKPDPELISDKTTKREQEDTTPESEVSTHSDDYPSQRHSSKEIKKTTQNKKSKADPATKSSS